MIRNPWFLLAKNYITCTKLIFPNAKTAATLQKKCGCESMKKNGNRIDSLKNYLTNETKKKLPA